METRVRELYGSGQYISPAFALALGSGELYPPFTFYQDGLKTLKEEMTPNSTKNWHEARVPGLWKSFEHYKCDRRRIGNPLPTSVTLKLGWGEGLYIAFLTGTELLGSGVYTVNNCTFSLPTSAFGEPGFPIAGLPEFYHKRTQDDGFVPPPENLEALNSMALKGMLPGIKAELSLVNSLIELKDFKSLPKSLHKLSDFLSNFDPKKFFRFGRWVNTRRRTLKQILQGSADGYLQAKFNILPLLQDLTGVYNTITRVEAQIAELLTRAGQVQNRHFSRKWREFSDVSDASDWHYVFSPCERGTQITKTKSERTVSYQDTQFHAEIRYCFYFSDLQIAHAQLLGFLDALGVNLNPAIIWNAIPWSFVVDWIVGVSRFLDRFSTRLLEPRVNILSYLWSVKRDRTVHVQRLFADSDGTYLNNFQGMPTQATRETAYRRTVGLPDTELIKLSGLSQQEFVLGAALSVTRRPKRRTRS